jgi:hypothetical protein
MHNLHGISIAPATLVRYPRIVQRRNSSQDPLITKIRRAAPCLPPAPFPPPGGTSSRVVVTAVRQTGAAANPWREQQQAPPLPLPLLADAERQAARPPLADSNRQPAARQAEEEPWAKLVHQRQQSSVPVPLSVWRDAERRAAAAAEQQRQQRAAPPLPLPLPLPSEAERRAAAAEQRADLVHGQLQKQHDLLEAAVHARRVAEGEAGLLREQQQQQGLAAAEAESGWQQQLKQQLQDALSEKAALASSLEVEAQARMQQWAQAQQWRAAATMADADIGQAGLQIVRLRGQLGGAALAAYGSMATSVVQQSRAAAPEAVAWQPSPPWGLPPQPLPTSSSVPPPPPSSPPVQRQLQSPQAGAALTGEGEVEEAEGEGQAAPAAAVPAEAPPKPDGRRACLRPAAAPFVQGGCMMQRGG